MSKNGNYGSIKRLNWVQPKLDEGVTKSIPHNEAGSAARNPGAPVTRSGHSRLKPAINHEHEVGLYLGKAVLQPMKYGPGGVQFQRKRDSSGKFAPAQQAGQQSTAEEDQTDQQRDARLRHHRMLDRLQGKGNPDKGQSNATKAMVPGMSGADTPSSSVNDPAGAQVIGNTRSGQPIYDDPYHSAHSQFSTEDHQEAADAHSGMAQQMQASGDMAGAAQHQSAAQAHMQQSQDGMSPGGRFMDNLFGQQGAPEVQPDDMSQFSDLLGMGQGEETMSNPAIAGQGPETTMGPASPSPMAQDPGMEPMGDVGGPDALSSFLGQDDMAPGMDQNKPAAPAGMEGPKPGMINTATGGPVGPQTDVGESAASGGTFDLDELFGSAPGEEAGPEMGGDMGPEMGGDMGPDMGPEMGAEEPEMDVPESNAGAPGPDASFNDEDTMPGEEEEKEAEATIKALKALARYV